MDTLLVPFIGAILLLFFGYILKTNPNIFMLASSHNKDVVSMERADKSANIMMIFGLLMLLSIIAMFFLGIQEGYILMTLGLTLLMLFFICALNYHISRKFNIRTKAGIVAVFTLVFLLAIPVGMFYVLGEPKIKMEEDTLILNSVYRYVIPVEEVEEIELIRYLPIAEEKENGFQLFGVRRGKFYCPEWKHVHFLTQTKRAPYVMITTDDGSRFVFNLSNADKTITCYNEIRNKYIADN